MIKAVIFDFFGVICSDDYWQYAHQDTQASTVLRDYADVVNLGDIPWQAFVQKIAEATKTSIEQVNDKYSQEKVDPRMAGLIFELHKKYKTALLTNAHHDFIDTILTENNLMQIFDELIISSHLGIVKPDPRIFEYALEKLDIEAHEAVFIDDLERHTTSAREVGLKTIVFRDFEQCKTELHQLLSHS